MKKFVLVLLFMMYCVSSSASNDQPPLWVCSQPGTVQELHAVVVSVFSAQNVDEAEFERHVKKQTKNSFNPDYAPRCKEFSSPSKAEKYLNNMLKLIKKRNFRVLWINFSNHITRSTN